MAENSETSISVIQNGRTEDQKNIVKNDDAHVPDAETHHLENGDIKKIPEEEPTTNTEEVTTNSTTENTQDVAKKQELETKIEDGSVTVKNDTEVIEGVVEEIKEGIEIIHTFVNKENESKINHEVEGGFQFVNVNDKTVVILNEPKNDEIITLQEVTIIPLEEEQNRVSKNSKSPPKLVSWDTKKTILFYFFLIAFVVWIVAYYAFDTGLIPNDKSSKK